jgi:hypothetical protein
MNWNEGKWSWLIRLTCMDRMKQTILWFLVVIFIHPVHNVTILLCIQFEMLCVKLLALMVASKK